MKAQRILVTLACIGSLFVPLAASQVAPLRVEDVVAARSFSEFTPVEFSPDGKRLVYAAKDNRKRGLNSPDQYARTGVLLNGFGADLFVAQVATGEVKNLTAGVGNNWAPSWSPDGRYLAFLSDRDGSGQAKLWVSETTTGTMRKVSDAFARATEVQWLPNNRGVLLTVLPENLTPAQFADSMADVTDKGVRAESEPKNPDSTVVVYSSPAGGDHGAARMQYGAWNLKGYARDLAVVDVASGKTTRIVRGQQIAAYGLSPDGSHIALAVAKGFEKPGSQQVLFDLKLFSFALGELQTVATGIRLRSDGVSFSWAPDGARLVYQTSGAERVNDCYLVELRGSAPRNITHLRTLSHHGAPPPLWDPEGRHIYFLHNDGVWKASLDGETAAPLAKVPGHRVIEVVARQGVVASLDGNPSLVALTYDQESKQSGFYAFDLQTGETVKLLEKNQWYAASGQEHNVSLSPDGKVMAFFQEDAQHAQEVWLASPDFRNMRRLTHLNAQLDKYQMGEARLIEWRSLDGELLHGALLLPAGYAEGKSYPLIVCVYGGASLSNSLVQFGLNCGAMNMQLFATRGYAVLLPDAPQRPGTPMEDLAKTVLPGVEKVIEMGIADPARLGIMGHSYGGYSVLSLIVQTGRFKAAMAADGLGDLMASYGQMNEDGSSFAQTVAETGQMLMGGTPWQFRERYIENSPIFYLDRVATPLLIVHGAADLTVPSFLGDEVFVGLRRLGKEVSYAKYGGEGHSPLYWSYANEMDFCNRVIAWFDSHCK